MTDNRNSEQDVIAEVPNAGLNNSSPKNSFLRLISTNLLCSIIVFGAGWYFLIRPYIGSIESQLSETMIATRGVAPMSEVQELRRSIDTIQTTITSLEKYGHSYAQILQDVKRIDAQIKDLEQKVSADAIKVASAQGWPDELVAAINAAEPLASFRENSLVPEKIREMLVGVDFIPTYKNVSEGWARIRGHIKFQSQPMPKTVTVSESWWGGLKSFLKSIFKVQRLDKNNLTPEEVFVRKVDTFLIDSDSVGLSQWVNSYMNRFDEPTQSLVKLWMDKLQRYQQGQSILKMVKRNK